MRLLGGAEKPLKSREGGTGGIAAKTRDRRRGGGREKGTGKVGRREFPARMP